MALDSKLIAFSHHVYNSLSFDDVTEYYGSESLTEADLKEIRDPLLLKAIFTIKYFYHHIFRNSAKNDKTEYQESREKFSSYISRMCNSEIWFGKQTVFERFFSTIAFVITCSEYLEESLSDMKGYICVSWTEHFNEYTEEFYNKGGWTELRKLANSYVKVRDFVYVVNPSPESKDLLIKTSKSVENYVYFCLIRVDILKAKKDDESNAHKSRALKKLKMQYDNKHKTFTSLWIKFMAQNVNAQSFDASCIQPPNTTSEVTSLLRALRNLCVGLRDVEKNKKESYDSHKNLSYIEATGQESFKPIIKNVPLQNTVAEKECEDKNRSCGNYTGGENDGTKNASNISSLPGKVLSKSNEWKTVDRKGRYKVSDENFDFSEEMGEVSSNSIVNNVSIQITTVEEDLEDGRIPNCTGENDGTDNVPYTSSMDSPVLKKPNKKKKNRNKKELKVHDKNLESVKAPRQASINSNFKNVSQQNTAEAKELGNKDSQENVAGGENDWTGKEPNNCLVN